MYSEPLCPVLSPAYAFTSFTLFKAQRVFLDAALSSLPSLFSLLCLPFICSTDLFFTFLTFTSPHSSVCIFSLLHPCIRSHMAFLLLLLPHLSTPCLASLLLLLLTLLLLLLLRFLLPLPLFTILPSFPLISLHPSLLPPPLLSPPPFTLLMIAEHISFDMKTKGWVHMWFLCKSCVIWNINVGIIWLPAWGAEVGAVGAS